MFLIGRLFTPYLPSHRLSPPLTPAPGGIHSPGFESADSLSSQSLMNADGLYLVSYHALLLNLKLCCCDYYRRRTMAPGLGLVSQPLPRPLDLNWRHQFVLVGGGASCQPTCSASFLLHK